MLSSGQMMRSGFVELVPVETLIVDEASQVEVGDYLIPLARFHSTLQKIIFIGDDKQCMYLTFLNHLISLSCPVAPHGHEEIPTLKSVFEMPHLREKAEFLNTQCLLYSLLLFNG